MTSTEEITSTEATSTRPSIEEVPLTSRATSEAQYRDSSFTNASSLKDSILSYSTDIISSIETTTYDNDYNGDDVTEKKVPSKPVGPPFYRKKRFWSICTAVTVVLSAIFIPLLFLVIIPSVAQSSIRNSEIKFRYINITDTSDQGFTVNMLGDAINTGAFKAVVEFEGPLEVSYNNEALGSVSLDPFEVSGGHGVVKGINQRFNIANPTVFANFTKHVMSGDFFDWNLKGTASVRALGIKTNVNVDKTIKIPGGNGFSGTKLNNMKISLNADQGFHIIMETNVHNPSPLSMEVGKMALQVFLGQTALANVTSDDFNITFGDNHLLLTGDVKKPETLEDILSFGKIISAYLTNHPVETTAKGLYTVLQDGHTVNWLNSTIEGVSIVTEVGNLPKAPQVISGIDFGQLTMIFTPDAPYTPTLFTSGTTAYYVPPFDIEFNINSLKQKATIHYQGNPVAVIETPELPVITTNNTINFDIPKLPMTAVVGSENSFSEFLKILTTTPGAEVQLVGETSVNATTPIGDIVIDGMPFNITYQMEGLNQFSNKDSPPTVGDVNVLGGTSNQLVLGIDVTLINPSNDSVYIGPVEFDLFYKDGKIGTAFVENLFVVPGPNPLNVTVVLDDPVNNAGKEALDGYLSGEEGVLTIKGSDASTKIPSLIPAFKAMNIQTPLAPFNKNLVTNAQLKLINKIPIAVVELSNPFDAPISIYTMNSKASVLGTAIDPTEIDIKDNPIFLPGHSTKTIGLIINLPTDPAASFAITRKLAVANNMDVTVFDYLMALGNLSIPGVDPNIQPTPEAKQSFDLAKFTTTALAKIPTSIELQAQAAIGDYFMPLSYKQNAIIETDDSILELIPVFAQPLIQNFMSQTKMVFDSVFIKNIDATSFDTTVSGKVLNTGPFTAEVDFPNGVTVSSNNVVLGTAMVLPINTTPDTSILNGTSKFLIADVSAFTSFSQNLMAAETITWDVSTDNVVIKTLGITFGPIPYKSSIGLAGFNGLKNFQTQQFTPSVNSIKASVAINSPATIGMEMGKAVFDVSLGQIQLAQLTSQNLVIQPNGVSDVELEGPITDPNFLPDILKNLGAAGTITVQGDSVTPPTGVEVSWLTAAFKSVSMQLPLDPSKLIGTPKTP